MNDYRNRFLIVAMMLLALAGCATAPIGEAPADRPQPGSVLRGARVDGALEQRILALDPERISDRDVRETLSKAPAPRIMLLHGGIYPVHLVMESTGRFLARLGYPEKRIRDPYNQDWSYTPYDDSAKMAGMLAWDYEHTGLRGMIIGHSQGGVQAVKILRELTGQLQDPIAVFNPITHDFEDRTTIVDPYTGRTRPVIGLSTSYVSVVGAGGAAFLLPNQWNMVGKLRDVPDSVDDFTGFFITVDLIAWDGISGASYRPNGTAKVRNVTLPVTYNHVFVPLVADLAQDPITREWMNNYAPGKSVDISKLPLEAQDHVLWAADIWYSVKKHWCLEAQHLVQARRASMAEAAREPATAPMPAPDLARPPG